jgi:AcrR family transcriptional regulator
MGSDTSDEILEATGSALCNHGYADLTMQRIAAESSITKAAIHYHYDTKEALLNAFLDDLLDRFEKGLAGAGRDPGRRLESFLDVVFAPAETGNNDFPIALMELKAQAPYHDPFRDRLRDLDGAMRTVLESIVRDGIDDGCFERADPEEVARLATTITNGGHVRTVALGEPPKETRDLIERSLELRLGWTPNGEGKP